MYSVNMYQYSDKPFTKTRKYEIHPLNEPGLEKYFGPESHCVNYLDTKNPKVIKNITGLDYDTMITYQQDLIKENQNKAEQSKQPSNDINQPQLTSLNETNPQLNKTYKNENTVAIKDPNQQPQNSSLPIKDTTQSIQNSSSFSPIKNTLPPINSQKNSYFKKFHKRRTFSEIYGYDNTKKCNTIKGNCLNEINTLKNQKLLKGEFKYSSINNISSPKKRYDGFSSYAIPRTDNENDIDNRSNAFKQYNKQLNKSLSCNLWKRKISDQELKMNEENEMMRSTLIRQTNRNFLKENKLPDLLNLVRESRTIRKFKLGNSKEMGERYNPYALIGMGTGDKIGRNFVGALFQH